eukprot:scaffold23358_cov47-Attheya_sp.AAC.3
MPSCSSSDDPSAPLILVSMMCIYEDYYLFRDDRGSRWVLGFGFSFFSETGLRIIELAQNDRWPDEIYWVMILPLRKGAVSLSFSLRVIASSCCMQRNVFTRSAHTNLRGVCRQSSRLRRRGQRSHFSVALASYAPLLKR